MQTKKMSMVETLTSTAIGYAVATAANFFILPLFGYPVTLSHASSIGLIFTLISLVRGYLVRRLFNWIQYRRRSAFMKNWMNKFKDIDDPEGCQYCGAIAGTCSTFPDCPEGRRSQVEQRLS